MSIYYCGLDFLQTKEGMVNISPLFKETCEGTNKDFLCLGYRSHLIHPDNYIVDRSGVHDPSG